MSQSTTSRFGASAAVLGLVCMTGCGASTVAVPRPNMTNVETIRTSLNASSGGTTSDSGPAAEPTGFATLRGMFKLNGSPPEPAALSVTKDESVCAPGGKTVYANELELGPSNGISNVLIYVDKVPETWIHPDAKPGKTDEVEFDQKDCIFLTRVVAMQTSQSLKILNSDPVGHNLMVASFNQTIPSSGVANYKPLKELRAPVEMRCAVHPWMKAWFINRDNGYFTLTNPDGSFELPNLPAGVDIELRVWHEKSGPISVATVNGESTKWSKGKMKLNLAPDSEQDMDVMLDVSVFQ